MDPDLLEFFRRERAGLRENVLRNGQLPDVVQKRGGLDRLQFFARYADRFRQPARVELHAKDVRVAHLVLRVDRARERLDRGQMQIRRALAMAFGFESSARGPCRCDSSGKSAPASAARPRIRCTATPRRQCLPNPRRRDSSEPSRENRLSRWRSWIAWLAARRLSPQGTCRRRNTPARRPRAAARRPSTGCCSGARISVKTEPATCTVTTSVAMLKSVSVHRLPRSPVQLTLAERAGRCDIERRVGPDQNHRGEVDRVRHRQRRHADGERQRDGHAPGGQRQGHERQEQDWLRKRERSASAAVVTRRRWPRPISRTAVQGAEAASP